MSDTKKLALARGKLYKGLENALGSMLGVTGGKLVPRRDKSMFAMEHLWEKRFAVLSPVEIPSDTLREASWIPGDSDSSPNIPRKKGRLVPIYEHLCVELYRSFHAWKHNHEKGDKRKECVYSDFVDANAVNMYVFSQFIGYAIKTRNNSLHDYLRKMFKTQRYHDQEGIISWVLCSCLAYGNLEALRQWLLDIRGRFDVSNEYGLFTFYADEKVYGTSFIGGMSCDNITDVMFNGHTNSLKYMRKYMSPEGFKNMCTLRSSLYAVAKRRRTKVVDMLVESGAYEPRILFRPIFTHQHSNSRYFTKIANRYWLSTGTEVKRLWWDMSSHLRVCTNRQKNVEMVQSPVGKAVLKYLAENETESLVGGEAAALFSRRQLYSFVIEALCMSKRAVVLVVMPETSK